MGPKNFLSQYSFLAGLNNKFYLNVTGDNVTKTPISRQLIQDTFLFFRLHTSRLASLVGTAKRDSKAPGSSGLVFNMIYIIFPF